MSEIDPVKFGIMVGSVEATKDSVGRIETLLTKHVEKDAEDKDDIAARCKATEDKQLIHETQQKTFKKVVYGGAGIFGFIKGVFLWLGS
tara:strand:+ start:1131 stop:1397 length:267 start_codon:yes stop_codon:yes gene_type:complete